MRRRRRRRWPTARAASSPATSTAMQALDLDGLERRATPTPRWSRPCPTRRSAASCCRTCAATATAGRGSRTSPSSAATSTSSAAGPRRRWPASPPYDGKTLWVAGQDSALRPRRVRRGDGPLLPAQPPRHDQGRRALGALGAAGGLHRGAAPVPGSPSLA